MCYASLGTLRINVFLGHRIRFPQFVPPSDVPVRTPLVGITMHIMQAERIWLEFRYGRRECVAIVPTDNKRKKPLVKFAGLHGSLVKEVAPALTIIGGIAPLVRRARPGSACKLPLCLRWESDLLANLLAYPVAKSHGIVVADVDDGVIVRLLESGLSPRGPVPPRCLAVLLAIGLVASVSYEDGKLAFGDVAFPDVKCDTVASLLR